MTPRSRIWLLAILLLALAPPARAATPALEVAAAASLRPALDELARAFEASRPPARVAITYGASGVLLAQVRAGAPFDLFLSADRDYPEQAVRAGLARAEDEAVYATGRLALWVPSGSPLDDERRGIAALAGASRIAIANPAVAPYGRAAEAALRGAGLLDAVRDRLVLGESVAQAAQFACTGAVDAALLPLAVARLPRLAGAGRAVPVPEALAPPLAHAGVILRGARDPALARAFLDYARGEAGRAVLGRHGFGPP